jgi:hypothetical protein
MIWWLTDFPHARSILNTILCLTGNQWIFLRIGMMRSCFFVLLIQILAARFLILWSGAMVLPYRRQLLESRREMTKGMEETLCSSRPTDLMHKLWPSQDDTRKNHRSEDNNSVTIDVATTGYVTEKNTKLHFPTLLDSYRLISQPNNVTSSYFIICMVFLLTGRIESWLRDLSLLYQWFAIMSAFVSKDHYK